MLVIGICFTAGSASCKTGYVSDMLLLTFRQGPGNNFAVEKTLSSNTPVEILEEQNGFYKVALKSGETGWVDKKFIIFELPNALKFKNVSIENQELKDQVARLNLSLDEYKADLNKAEEKYSQMEKQIGDSLKKALGEQADTKTLLEQSRQQYNELLKSSQNIQQIVKESKVLKAGNEELSKKLAALKEKNSNLFKTSMIKWFLTGAGVLLLGWIIGQSVSSKRNRTYSLLK